jgi:phosphatidylcholine synthase
VLDLVVDFTTYVFVPAFAMAVGGLLPPLAGVAVAMAIAVGGAIYFADSGMKLPGHYFRGFPALWNVAAFYLFLLTPPSWLAAAGLLVLLVLSFAPFRFVHPARVRRWRGVNLVLVGAWVILALVALARDLAPGPWVNAGLCAVGLYFFAFGLLAPRESKEPG